jgi:hypothetical protein
MLNTPLTFNRVLFFNDKKDPRLNEQLPASFTPAATAEAFPRHHPKAFSVPTGF